MKLHDKIFKKVRSVRVKAVEIHPSKPICVVGLYNGYLQTWNTTTCTLINETQVTEYPIRTLAIIEKNNFVFIGCDDFKIYVYELTNLQLINVVEAHDDFIRKIIVHHKNDELVSCSDDGSIKLWRISNTMKCIGIFMGHSHFVMDICYYPKDTNLFLSCSLDGTVKLWNKEQNSCLKTYKGHTSGINTLSFCANDNYFVTGSDDLSLKIWDINSLQCISTMKEHTNNVLYVYVMKNTPYLVSCSEDGSYKLWDTKIYECKKTVNLNSGRVWQFKGRSDVIVIGTDEELIFKRIVEVTNFAILANKKIFFTKQNTVNICKVDDFHNSKKICEIDFIPSEVKISKNGKLISMVQNEKFEIFSSLGFRSRLRGNGCDFYFCDETDEFVAREDEQINFYRKTEIYKSLNLQNLKKFIFLEKFFVGIFYGYSNLFTCDGKYVFKWHFEITCVTCISSYLVVESKNKLSLFRINTELINAYLEQELEITDDGIQDSMELLNEYSLKIDSSCKTKDLFIFVSAKKLHYIILMETPCLYTIGYFEGSLAGIEDDKIFVLRNEKIELFKIDLEFLNFQKKVLQGESCEVLDSFRMRAITFYESINKFNEALEICKNENQKFEILIRLDRLDEAFVIACSDSMFDKLGTEYLEKGHLSKAADCFSKSNNWKSLFFADLLSGKKHLKSIQENCIKNGNDNLALLASFKLKDYETCGVLLKDSKFKNIFAKNFLNK